MVWDFAEANPFCTSTGNWMAMCNWVWKVIAGLVPKNEGLQHQHDAQTVQFPKGTVISTDPPYYDNIGYADLSDFFFCWMKPLIRQVYPDLFGVLATPKSEELVATPYRHGGKKEAESFFLDGMSKVIASIARQSSPDYPATIYYAFKQSEIAQEGVSSTGWATFLQAVLEADDSPMTVKTALQLINRELDDYLGGIQGEFDVDTRFAITWFEQHGMAAGDYGAANSIATARGISVDSVKHAGIVASAGGEVRILNRDEIDAGWEPGKDTHLTVWECCQHLIRELEQGGEQAAALLLRKMGPVQADAARDLAYCLYDICANKRRDAGEATPYNGLIAVWAELTRQAAAIHDVRGDRQRTLDL